MATETMIFMPNGDVTLTLMRYVFKEEDSSPAPVSSKSPSSGRTDVDEEALLNSLANDPEAAVEEEEESEVFFAPDPPDNPNAASFPPTPRARRGSNASSRRDRSESPPAAFWATLKRQAARVNVEPNEDKSFIPAPPPAKAERVLLSSHEVHCVVSSRHMMLASRHFETILNGEFNEAITLRSTGHVTIRLQDDLDSMIILLNIIHGAGRKVPRQVSLDVLSKLAVLVSKFEMLPTVEFFSDTWIDNLQRGGLPKTYNENVLPLVFVFWVFDRPDEFKNMTRLAQRESTEKLEDEGKDIPIQHNIIDAIKRDREFAIETAITIIHAMIDRYMAGQAICDSALDDELRYACDAMVLGCLMTSSRKLGIWPKPDAPFIGKKLKDIVKDIRSIRILDVCNKTSSRRWNSHGPSPNAHGLEDSIEVSMKSIEAGLDGLNLADYPKPSVDYSLISQRPVAESPILRTEQVAERPKQSANGKLQVYLKEDVLPTEQNEVNTMLDPQQHLTGPPRTRSPRNQLGKTLSSSKEQETRQAPSRESSRESTKDSMKPRTLEFIENLSESERKSQTPHQGFAAPLTSPWPRIEPWNVQKAIKEQEPKPATSREHSRESNKTFMKPNSPELKIQALEPLPVVSSRQEFSPLSSTLPHSFKVLDREAEVSLSRVEPKAMNARNVSPGAGASEDVRAKSRERDQPVQEGVKVSPRQYSQEFQQLRVPVSPKHSLQSVIEVPIPSQEESKPSPRVSPAPSQRGAGNGGVGNGNGNGNVNNNDIVQREDLKRASSISLVSNLSPDEVFREKLMVGKEGRQVKDEVKEVRNENLDKGPVEAEEVFVPPKSFKMKKAKKTFSTRY